MNSEIKTTFFCLFIALASFSYVEGKCSSDNDCEIVECCVKKIDLNIFRQRECKPRPKKGQSCYPLDLLKEVRGVCPCGEGLECKPEKTDGVLGNLGLTQNYICRSPDEPTETENPTEETVTDGSEDGTESPE